MNYAIAARCWLCSGLLTLVSYVDRVYTEIGKFLSREFQENIDAFEQTIEPRLGCGRARAALSMAVLTQIMTAAIAMMVGFCRVPRPCLERLRNSAGHAQPGSDHHPVLTVSCPSFSSRGPRAVADPLDACSANPDLRGPAGHAGAGIPAIGRRS